MTETAPTQEDIRKALEELERAVDRARKVRQEGEAFLRIQRPIRERRRKVLRRAGLLPD